MKVNFFLTLNKWLFFIALFLICGLNTVNANNSLLINNSVDIYLSEKYQENQENQLSHFLLQQRLLSEEFGSKNDFELIARVNPLYRDLDFPTTFDLSPIDWSIAKSDGKDWLVQNKEIISKNSEMGLNKSLAIHLTQPSLSDQRESFRDYNELWIDYKFEEDRVLCGISASLDFVGIPWSSKKNLETEKARWVAFFGEKQLKTKIFTVDAKKSKWLKKDSRYLLSRILGLSSDGYWRYTQDGPKVVVQRQMRWPVNTFSSLLVKHSNLYDITGASLLVKFEDEYGGGELVHIPFLDSLELPDGDFGIELDIGHAIEKKFPEKMKVSQIEGNRQQAYLQEVFFHFAKIDSNNINTEVEVAENFVAEEVLHSVSLMNRIVENTNKVNDLKKAASSDAVNSTWKEISFIDGFKQLFGSTQGIESWNWQQTSDGIEVKKTLNWTFRPNSKLAIYVEPYSIIPSISLQFGTKHKKGLVKTLYDPVVSKLTEGKFAVLIDLDNLVVDQLLESMNDEGEIALPILHNIEISLPGSAKEIITKRKLREVALFEKASSLDNIDDLGFVLQTYYHPLSSLTEKVGFQRGRRIIDLSKLTAIPDMVMNGGVLYIYIPDKQSNCEIEIDSIRLASTYKTNKLDYLSEVENWNKKYGGNFLDAVFQYDLIEGMKFLAYSSPEIFYNAKENYEKITNIPVGATGDVLVDKITTTTTDTMPIVVVDNYKKDVSKDKWLSVDGIQLTSSGQIISAKSTEQSKGVQFKGEGRSVHLLWPAKTKLDKQSVFYLDLPKGKENIHSIQLNINGRNGEKWQRLIKANEPVLLTNTPREIDSAEIKLTFKDFAFDFVLNELAIVSPIMLTNEEALISEIPWKDGQLLESGLSSVGVEQLGKLSDENVSFWSEEIDNGWVEAVTPIPATWTERVGISYQIPSEWLGTDGCILEGDFIFVNQTLHRSFCLNQASATHSFSAGGLGILSQEKLEKIVWRLQKPKGESGQVTLNTWINSRGMSSVYNQIQHSPLFYLGNKPYYLSNDNIQEISSRHGFWSSLPQQFLNEYIEYPSLLRTNKNPWFEVERIAVAPRGVMSLDRWLSLIKPIEFEKKFNWLKLIGFVLFAWLAVIIIRKGRWSYKQSAISSTIRFVSWQLPQMLVKQFWKIGLYLSRWINILLAIIFVPVLIWFSARIDDVLVSYILLTSTIFLSVNVFRFWKQFGLLEKRSDNAIWLEVTWGVFSALILLLLFFVSKPNFQIQWYMIILILVAFYGVLPEIVSLTSNLYKTSKDLLMLIIWGGIALILYMVGLMTAVNLGENYYFTFGGIAVVIAWQSLVRCWKPSVESRWPALSEKVYGGAGAQYFSGFIVVLVGVSVILMFKLDPIAEQLAVIGYYMLVVGVVLEILALRKDKANSNQENSIDT